MKNDACNTAQRYVRRSMLAVGFAIVFTASIWAQSQNADVPTSARCIAIVAPVLEGVPGNALDAGAGVRDVIVSYLTGPSVKVVLLEAKLLSQAREEAKQKQCEPVLFTKLTRKTGGGKALKALGQVANTTSWQLPGGGTAATAAVRAGAAGGLQAVSAMAQSTKAKDEVTLEYRLESANGQVQFGPRTEHQTAKVDGEDLLTPVSARAAEAIVTQRTKP